MTTTAPPLSTGLPRSTAAPARYAVSLAPDEAGVRAAQRLRHDVFAGELGAGLATPEPGLDIDPFDAYCDHLLVTDTGTGEAVGTCRLLPPERARIAGRLYAETEFDLAAHADLRPGVVEVGRSCVHPAHRDGAVISLMWAGIARYLTDRGHDWLAGCCSLSLADGGTEAAAVCRTVAERHLAPDAYRVRPHLPWLPPDSHDATAVAGNRLPPLLRGYLRLGAWVCGPPAHDPEFGVADLYVLLDVRRISPRYLRHFLSMAPA